MMSVLRSLCAAVMILSSAPALAQPAPQALASVVPAIDRAFADYQRDSHVPGLVYGIVADGRLVHLKALGTQDTAARRPVTADTLFRIASMSKAFTALAVLKLRDEGKLSLDALAETYVPELRDWRYPTADSPRIRVRDLLSHSAGFVTDDPWGDRQQPLSEAEFTRMLKAGVPFTRAPGIAFEYSNFGYALLGRIVTNVSGVPYDRYIQENIQRPLGMASTGYEVRDWPLERRAIGYRWENDAWREEPTMPHGAFGAMGGVQTSASDYSKWVAFLLAAWPARDGAETGPVRRATVRELVQGSNFAATRLRPRAGVTEPCPMSVAYGMGFIAGQDCQLGTVMFHGGGFPGYGSFLLLLPDHNVGLFALANRTYAGPSPPVYNAAQALFDAGLLKGRTLAVSPALATAYRAAGAMYEVGRLDPGRNLLAMNFLMDASAESWTRQFADLRRQTGRCDTRAPITATGALAGRFSWTCERAKLDGALLLAPTNPPDIQSLRFTMAPNEAAATRR